MPLSEDMVSPPCIFGNSGSPRTRKGIQSRNFESLFLASKLSPDTESSFTCKKSGLPKI